MSKKKITVIAVVLGVVVVGGVGAAGLWTYHEQPQFCATCHIMEPYLESWQASDYGAYAHAVQDVTCLDCHVPTVQQQVDELAVYLQGDFTVPVEQRDFGDDFCFDCHLPNEHTSEGDVVQLTAGLEVNPHDSHLVGELDCETCHRMHGPSQDYCAQCHEPVATGAGWTGEVTRTAEVEVWAADMDCSACHVMDPYFDSLQDSNLLAYAHAQQGLSCLDCHADQEAVKQSHEEAIPGEPLAELKVNMEFCFDCHVDNEHTSYEQIVKLTTDLVSEVGANPHVSHSMLQCSACHKNHRESVDFCAQCHLWGWQVP
jgi:nitrate/TMAO reductase-like tetraheme cytochrome c subunit